MFDSKYGMQLKNRTFAQHSLNNPMMTFANDEDDVFDELDDAEV